MGQWQTNSGSGRAGIPDEWNRITGEILGAAIEVHSQLGPGLLERLYEQALCHELSLRKVQVRRQHPIRLTFKGMELGEQFVDLVVEGLVVVELKSVERVSDTHLSQLMSYMRSASLPLGLLINFNVAKLKEGIYRRVITPNGPIPRPMLEELSPPRPSALSANSVVS
ncbi:MAG: GxxExxY protein [Phycisphaeraceae bacterium]|nr:GxxExxY protein [Phycisphaeraceae bacterium]MBX3368000.1 GxxExxY protein [Phycisphaeraceae bacterium]